MVAEIRIKTPGLKKVERMFARQPRTIKRIMYRSINRAGTQTKGKMARLIKDRYNLLLKHIRQCLILIKPSYNRWVAEIRVRDKRIPLGNFAARKTARGASYQIERSQGRKQLKYRPEDRVFFSKLPSGHKGIFKRRGKNRLPIVELFGPSIGGILANKRRLARKIERESGVDLEKLIDDQIKVELAKK